MGEHFRKDAAIDFLKRVAAGQVAEAFERHVGPGFRHHNPHIRGDAASLREAMEDDAKRYPHKILDVQVALQDGEQVAVLSRIAQNTGDPVWAVVHIFRFDGKRIVEMWDVGQAVPDKAVNEYGMF
jgi:predicted SnoaL-like aldol condensation-catalyzing enzyme